MSIYIHYFRGRLCGNEYFLPNGIYDEVMFFFFQVLCFSRQDKQARAVQYQGLQSRGLNFQVGQ